MNTPVSFELAKLVIQKGFDKECKEYWNLIEYSSEWIVEHRINLDSIDFMCAPTISDVVMWLYEKHGIWISVHEEGCRGYIGFDFNIVFLGNHEKTVIEQDIQYEKLGEIVFNSPTEAYEAAIEYALDNLI